MFDRNSGKAFLKLNHKAACQGFIDSEEIISFLKKRELKIGNPSEGLK